VKNHDNDTLPDQIVFSQAMSELALKAKRHVVAVLFVTVKESCEKCN